MGTVFHKLTVKDGVPGRIDGPEGYANAGEEDCLASLASSQVLQSDATALVVSHPHLALAGTDGNGGKPITRMRQSPTRTVRPSAGSAPKSSSATVAPRTTT